MKTLRYIKNENGVALVAAMVIMLLLLVLGTAAMQMSQFGFTAISAEKKYQIANWAAEYAVQEGLRVTVAANTCPEDNSTGSAGGGSYTYYRVPSSNFCYIYATGTHPSGAKVVKTVVIPWEVTAGLGAVTLRNGGSLSMGGSSSIVNCDTDCKTPAVVYGTGLALAVNAINDDTTCPNNPRGLYGSPHAVQDVEGDACNVLNGNCSASPQMPDRIPVIFESVNNWAELISLLSTIYSPSGHTLDVPNLSISGMPPLVNVTVPATPDPPSSCECTNTGNFTLTATTTSSNPGTPSSTTVCSGVTDIASCGSIEFINSTGILKIEGIPAGISTIVSRKAINVTDVISANGNFDEKNLYTTNSATITIDDVDVRLTNAKIISDGNLIISNIGFISTTSNDATKRTLLVSRDGNITLTTTGHIFTNITLPCDPLTTSPGVTCETALVAKRINPADPLKGNISMSNNVRAVNDREAFSPRTVQYVLLKADNTITLISNNVTSTPKGINYVKAEATGNITTSGSSTINNSILHSTAGNISITDSTINDSILVTSSNTGDILFTGGILNRTTFLTKDLFRVANSANVTIMTDNKVFARTIGFVKGSGNVSGGLFYSQADFTFLDSTGNTRIGCVGLSNSPPLTEICEADCNPVLFIIGGNLILEGRGTVDIFGSVFVNGVINYAGGGGFAITGTVVSNSTTGTSSFSGGGNANIRFSSCIINYLKNDHPFVRRPNCGSGGGERGPYITNTKITVY